MDERKNDVPRWTHEADMARAERTNKRLALLLAAALAVNAALIKGK